jgi:phosphoglycolate phosphatase
MRFNTALRAAFFDQDGTLVDSLAGIEFAVDDALAVLGLPVRNRDLRSLIGPPIRQIFKQLLPDTDEQLITNLEAAFRTCYDSSGWSKTVLHENAALVLEELSRAGVQLFLVTNKPAFSTHRILEALNIRQFFQAVLCRDTRNPCFESKAEMLEHLVGTYNLPREECLYIGDTYEDYLAGAESGIPVAVVIRDQICDDHRCPDDIICRNLIEILPDNKKLKEIA